MIEFRGNSESRDYENLLQALVQRVQVISEQDNAQGQTMQEILADRLQARRAAFSDSRDDIEVNIEATPAEALFVGLKQRRRALAESIELSQSQDNIEFSAELEDSLNKADIQKALGEYCLKQGKNPFNF